MKMRRFFIYVLLVALCVGLGGYAVPRIVDSFVTSNVVQGVTYFPNPGETDQGAAGNGRTIKAYVDLIGGTRKATIKLRHTGVGNTTVYTLTTSETVTSNIELDIAQGAILHFNNGATLTQNGPFDPGLYQVFTWTGTGKVVFGPGTVDKYDTKWWGDTGDGSTYDEPAINAAGLCGKDSLSLITDVTLSRLTGGVKVYISRGAHLIDDTIMVYPNVPIDFEAGALLKANSGIVMMKTQDPDDNTTDWGLYSPRNMIVNNPTLDGDDVALVGLSINTIAAGSRILNPRIYNVTGTISAITGSITDGTSALVVSDASELFQNQVISIVGVTGYYSIRSIAGNNVTLNLPAVDATVVGAAVTHIAVGLSLHMMQQSNIDNMDVKENTLGLWMGRNEDNLACTDMAFLGGIGEANARAAYIGGGGGNRFFATTFQHSTAGPELTIHATKGLSFYTPYIESEATADVDSHSLRQVPLVDILAGTRGVHFYDLRYPANSQFRRVIRNKSIDTYVHGITSNAGARANNPDPQFSDWVADTVYALNVKVVPTGAATGYYYAVTTAGTSDSSEPSPWDTTEGGTTADNTVTWTTRVDYALFEQDSSDGSFKFMFESGFNHTNLVTPEDYVIDENGDFPDLKVDVTLWGSNYMHKSARIKRWGASTFGVVTEGLLYGDSYVRIRNKVGGDIDWGIGSEVPHTHLKRYIKQIDLSAASTNVLIQAIPGNSSFIPISVQARVDNDIAATNGDFWSIGVQGANRRVDFGVCTTAAAAGKHSQNAKIRWLNSSELTNQIVAAGEGIRLMSVDGTGDAAALSNNMGGAAGDQITVVITGWLIEDLDDV